MIAKKTVGRRYVAFEEIDLVPGESQSYSKDIFVKDGKCYTRTAGYLNKNEAVARIHSQWQITPEVGDVCIARIKSAIPDTAYGSLMCVFTKEYEYIDLHNTYPCVIRAADAGMKAIPDNFIRGHTLVVKIISLSEASTMVVIPHTVIPPNEHEILFP